jgi:hypothetical protein
MINYIFITVFSCICSFSILATPNYNINLMWVNKEKNEEQKFFCSNTEEKNYEKACLNPIIDWLDKADKASSLNIWYDSETTNKNAINKFIRDIKEKAEKNLKKLHLMDLRELPDVKNNQDIFDMSMPIYFRVDLLRAIVADHLAKKADKEFVVYADLNIPSMDGDDLFDKETLVNLDKYGFVMAKNNAADLKNNYENAFFIINANNKELVHASRTMLIDANIERGKEFLKRGYTKQGESERLGGRALCKSIFNEIIYISYKTMFAYYLYLQMALEIVFEKQLNDHISYILENETDYDMKKSWDALIYIREHYNNMIFPVSWLHDIPNTNSAQQGYAVVSYTKLFNYDKTTPLVYLQSLREDSLSIQKRTQNEKSRRWNVPIDSLVKVHDAGLAKPFYRWRYTTYFQYDESLGLITLTQRLGSLPVKQVNKPISSFYNKSPISGDDC